jgi:hypothetical protein
MNFVHAKCDTVERLGRHPNVGKETIELLSEIKRRRVFCKAAPDDLERYVGRMGEAEAAFDS